ncbi:MAG: PqqD family protein [Chloroflexi bacterium]|nr:PqqD family protein [Chloroflexota bacterium]
MDNVHYSLAEDVIVELFDTEAIVVNLQTEMIYMLNETGKRIIELIQSGHGLHDILETLLDEYDVDESSALESVLQLVEDMQARELLIQA